MMKSFFITGTDTDCGKTYVSCQLLDYLTQNQKKALALKPVASGCIEKNGVLYSEDVLNLQEHNPDKSQQINGWLFAPPISPHLAAKQLGIHITANDLANFCLREKYDSLDYLLIEGAGGLLAPLNDEETWFDFLKLTQIPVIVVVGMKLGCINHALLTDAFLQTKQLTCAGWIANCLDKDMLVLAENIETLISKMHRPLLATIPYGGKISENLCL